METGEACSHLGPSGLRQTLAFPSPRAFQLLRDSLLGSTEWHFLEPCYLAYSPHFFSDPSAPFCRVSAPRASLPQSSPPPPRPPRPRVLCLPSYGSSDRPRSLTVGSPDGELTAAGPLLLARRFIPTSPPPPPPDAARDPTGREPQDEEEKESPEEEDEAHATAHTRSGDRAAIRKRRRSQKTASSSSESEENPSPMRLARSSPPPVPSSVSSSSCSVRRIARNAPRTLNSSIVGQCFFSSAVCSACGHPSVDVSRLQFAPSFRSGSASPVLPRPSWHTREYLLLPCLSSDVVPLSFLLGALSAVKNGHGRPRCRRARRVEKTDESGSTEEIGRDVLEKEEEQSEREVSRRKRRQLEEGEGEDGQKEDGGRCLLKRRRNDTKEAPVGVAIEEEEEEKEREQEDDLEGEEETAKPRGQENGRTLEEDKEGEQDEAQGSGACPPGFDREECGNRFHSSSLFWDLSTSSERSRPACVLACIAEDLSPPQRSRSRSAPYGALEPFSVALGNDPTELFSATLSLGAKKRTFLEVSLVDFEALKRSVCMKNPRHARKKKNQ